MSEKPALIEQLWDWHNSIEYTDLSARLLNAKLIEAIVDLTHRVEELEKPAPVMRSMYEAQAMYEDEEDLMKIQAKESEDEAAYYGRGFDAE